MRVTEGSGKSATTLTVTLSRAALSTVVVNWQTVSGTAVAGSDFEQASGTIGFNVGETTKTISVAIDGDTNAEPDETFSVLLSSPIPAIDVDLAKATGTVTIVNDDDAAPQRPNRRRAAAH